MWKTVYVSPFTSSLQKLKLFSATTGAFSLIASPLLMMTNSSVATTAGLVVLSCGIGTTGGLNWYLKPYVTRIDIESSQSADGDDKLKKLIKMQDLRIKVERLNIIGRVIQDSFRISDLEAANSWRPLVTFKSTLNNDEMFVHEEIFEDKIVLEAIERRAGFLKQ